MSLADYLAKNYLTADSKTDKKAKKRKRKEAFDGLVIADDDALGWNPNGPDKDEDDGPTTVGSNSAEFRKSKRNNWQTLGGPTSPSTPTDEAAAAADAIIASAAAESSARALVDDSAPAIATTPPPQQMSLDSTTRPTLQTAPASASASASATAQQSNASTSHPAPPPPPHQETIYRDASGRIINIAMQRATLRQQAASSALAAAAALEAQKGDVQRAAASHRKEALAEAKFMPLTRHADDAAMNEELRERERWNDPAARFLTSKKVGRSVTGKPLYSGPVAAGPNRYAIGPGYRWDGVDRGNGFEKEYFRARNRRENLKELDYAWQMDE